MERPWNATPLPCGMSPERLVASFLLRVAFRDGRREVRLQSVSGGPARRFASYGELIEHLETLEDAGGTADPAHDDPTPESR